MDFSIIPVAEASLDTLMNNINRVIVNPLIILLFALAMVYFIYGLAEYFLNPDNEEVRKASKSRMIYGIIGLFIMVSVFGIEKLILNTMNVKNIKINNSGDYEIVDPNSKATLTDTESNDNDNTYKPVDTNDLPVEELNLPKPALGLTYTDNPFPKSSPNKMLCWRETVYKQGKTYYEAKEAIKKYSREVYLKSIGVIPGSEAEKKIDPNLPLLYGIKMYYNEFEKENPYYAWQDVRAPRGEGTEADCSIVMPEPFSQSKKTSNSIGTYVTDNLYYRFVDSGVSIDSEKARKIAINNALIQVAKKRGIYDLSSITYTILKEVRIGPDEATGNFDYFVAIESPRF